MHIELAYKLHEAAKHKTSTGLHVVTRDYRGVLEQDDEGACSHARDMSRLLLVFLQLLLKLVFQSQVRLVLFDVLQYVLEYAAGLFLFRLIRVMLASWQDVVILVILSPALVICVSLRSCKSHLDELARHVHAYKVLLFSKVVEFGSQ